MSHPNLILMRDKRNRIGGLVAWDKMSQQYRKGYSTHNAIVTSYDTRLQQWICESLMFPWFNHR